MVIREKLRAHPIASILIAAVLALLLVVSFSLTLQVRAEPMADPTVVKQVNTDQAAPGDTLTYTIHVMNWVDDADLWLTDTLPTEVTYDSSSLQVLGSGNANYADGAVTWSCPLCPWGSQALITFTAQISPDLSIATIVNTAELTGTGKLITSSVSTEASPGKLEVSKQVDPSLVDPGEQVVYTIYMTNTGNGVVDAAYVEDSLPDAVDYGGGFNAVGGTGVISGVTADDVVTWTGQVAPSEKVTITFTADVSATLSKGTYFTNTVSVSGAGLPVTASAGAMVRTSYLVYFPVIYRNYPPTLDLNPISLVPPGSYTVTWQCDGCESKADYFTLQEASDAGFTQNVQQYTTTALFYPFDKGAVAETFYYRALANGEWGAGPWSNIEQISIGFYDNFNDPGSGWPDDQGAIKDTSGNVRGYWKRGYKDGDYRIYVPYPGCLDGCHWWTQPDAFAPYIPPSNKYCVETDVKFEDHAWAGNAGLVFGANQANTKLYALCLSSVNDELSWFVVYNNDYRFPGEIGHFACIGDKVAKGGSEYTSWDGWNDLKVGVDGNDVRVYVGGVHVATEEMSGLSNMTRVGVVGGTYEVAPIDLRFKNFRVTMGTDCQ